VWPLVEEVEKDLFGILISVNALHFRISPLRRVDTERVAYLSPLASFNAHSIRANAPLREKKEGPEFAYSKPTA
jgi:hypothetical protein